jgi:hypothetical protein
MQEKKALEAPLNFHTCRWPAAAAAGAGRARVRRPAGAGVRRRRLARSLCRAIRCRGVVRRPPGARAALAAGRTIRTWRRCSLEREPAAAAQRLLEREPARRRCGAGTPAGRGRAAIDASRRSGAGGGARDRARLLAGTSGSSAASRPRRRRWANGSPSCCSRSTATTCRRTRRSRCAGATAASPAILQRHAGTVAHGVPRPVRARRRVRRRAPVRPAAGVAAGQGPHRHADAGRLRLHGRLDRRQLGQPRSSTSGSSSSGCCSTATSSRSATSSSTASGSSAASASTRRASSRRCARSIAPRVCCANWRADARRDQPLRLLLRTPPT